MVDATQLYVPSFWTDNNAVLALLENLRRNDPVHQARAGEVEGGEGTYPPFWHITKHEDIFEIEKQSDVFLNYPRLIIGSDEGQKQVETLTGTPHLVHSLVTMDKPKHPPMRLLTQAWFMPKNLERLQSSIDNSAKAAIEALRAKNGKVDFSKDVALEFPMRVIMSVLGVPSEDYPTMLRLTQELFGAADPDMQRDEEPDMDSLMQTYLEYVAYFTKLTEDRRANPTDDVASIIANAEIDGEPISDMDAMGYYIIIATAGHDTTSYSLVEAAYQLAKNPEIFERLKQDPETMAPKIAEEAIRTASSVRHFLRTANEDYELRGKTIKKGDHVILWYNSGSRDEDVFENPNVFDPDRDQSTRHAAFGHAAHMCLGMHLARQEIVTFLKLLAENVESLELTEEPRYVHSIFVGGIKSLPIKATLKL